MQNINRRRYDQFHPPFYLESGQFVTRGLSLHSTNVVVRLNEESVSAKNMFKHAKNLSQKKNVSQERTSHHT